MSEDRPEQNASGAEAGETFDPQAEMARRMGEIRETFSAQLDERIVEIEAAWADVAANPSDPSRARGLQRLCHHLAGSAALFGYPGVGAAAHALDVLGTTLCDERRAPSKVEANEAVASLGDMRASARNPSPMESTMGEGAGAHYAAARSGKLILLVIEDQAQGAVIALGLREAGYRVRVITDPQRVEGAVVLTPPAAILMSTVFSRGQSAALAIVRRVIQGMEVRPGLVIASSRSDFSARLAALRGEADAFVEKSAGFRPMVDALDDVVFGESMARPRILFVSRAWDLADGLCRALDRAGAYVQHTSDAAEALETVRALRPELLLVDALLDSCTGPELACILRASGHAAGAEVMFGCADAAVATALTGAGVGTDDIVATEADPDTVAGAIVARVMAAREEVAIRDHAVIARLRAAEAALRKAFPAGEDRPAPPVYLHRRDSDGRRRILVVDDDPFQARAVRTRLEAEGFEVLQAGDGDKAYAIAARTPVDLVLTDHLMPHCSGLELIQRLRQSPATADLPIVVVTQHRVDRRKDFALERELIGRFKVSAYLQKPVDLDVLVEAVRRWMGPPAHTPAHTPERRAAG